MGAPRVIKDIGNRRLTVEKEFGAPLPKVWDAWANVEKLARWWGPKDWPATSRHFDFREGGRWHYCMTGPAGEQVWCLLQYLKIDPMAAIHTEDYFSTESGGKASDGPMSIWEVSFRKVSAAVTRVTTRLNFTTEARLEQALKMGFEAGYTSALDNLDQLLTGRAQPQTAVSKDGTPIVYEKVGSGPAVIIVGGAMVTRDLPAHTELAAALAGSHTVINYDRRGRGGSGDTGPYAIEREIEDLQALIAVAGGKAAVYGLSSGAILALHAASRGLSITKLVLYEPPFNVVPGDRKAPADSLAVVTRLVAENRRAAAVTYFMTKIFGMPAFMPWMMRLTPYWKPSLAVVHTLPHDLTIVGDYSIPPAFSAVAQPALVIYGDHTQPLLVHGAEAIARTLPNATLKALPGANHQIATDDLAPAVMDFLKEKRS